MSEITILGAYGTKGNGCETTCFLLNERNVLDAGNLLKGLGDKCADLDTVWLSHSHLDHIVEIAFLLDSFFEKRKKPLILAGLPATLHIIQKHFLNELIWPDFSKIHLIGSDLPAVEYKPIEIGVRYQIGEGEFVEPFKTNHTVPSCGYVVSKGSSSVAITADTYQSLPVWEIVNSRKDISSLVIECSFPSSMDILAKESKHLTPKLLEKELKKLKRDDMTIYINHLKPNFEDIIKAELSLSDSLKSCITLEDYDLIKF